MTVEHVPEVPTNVVARATGPTTITVTWDAPWYAGSAPLSGYEVVATDSSGRRTIHWVGSDVPAIQVKELVADDTYTFAVAARNAAGSSGFVHGAPMVMRFSATEFAKEEAHQVKGRLAASMRKSLMRSRPSAGAAQDSREQYRAATQQPDDEFESLRSFSRDEKSGWIPPTSDE